MKTKFSTLLLAGFLLVSCNQSQNDSHGSNSLTEESRPKTPEELKAELKRNEEGNPTEYLHAEGKWVENNVKVKEESLFSDAEYQQDGYNLTGTIQNKASVATFKDVVLTVKYLSQTQSVITSENLTVYEYAQPNHTINFEFKVNPPEAFVSMSIEVAGATPSAPAN